MAKRPTNPKELPDALREAVERTVESTLGSAGRSRDAAQGALDDLAETADDLRKGAEQRLARSRQARWPRRSTPAGRRPTRTSVS